ncbi:FtsX-like permease family protein [Streptomyces chartreusis]
MTTWYHSWHAAIRIARRDAWRSKGRSFLVLAMIALPIIGVSAADLTVRSAELSTEQSLERRIGAADARISHGDTGGGPIQQSPGGEESILAEEAEDQTWPGDVTDLRKGLSADSKVLEDSTGIGKLRTRHGLLNAEVRELNSANPMAAGIMTLIKGRFPQSTGEVAATTHFLESSGLVVGSKLSARGLEREYTVVGSYELPDELKADQINALPGALLEPLDEALASDDLPGVEKRTTYLIDAPGSFTWTMVKEANAKGFLVLSRAVLLDPPADADVPLLQRQGEGYHYGESAASQAAVLAVVGTVVSLAMLEVCLLAGPAFAVGARRSHRQLGLVGANGGDRRHIRTIVLAGGLVIGVAAAVLGTVLGLLLTLALRPLLEEQIGARFGSFDIRPLELLGIGLLAVLTGLLAAVAPAVTASRQTVMASLTGRRSVRRSSPVLPAIGLVAVLLGSAIALSDQSVLVAVGSALAELGVVALTPVLVGHFGRIGRWLPLSPRLALRDAVRNRGRTAPAVAAVLAAVAGTVAVATYTASQDAEGRASYEAQLPPGVVSLMVTEGSGHDVRTARAAVQKFLPADVRADVDRIAVGPKQCTMYYGGGTGICGRYEVVVSKANQCPLWSATAKDWRCKKNDGISYTDGGVLVGDTKLLDVLEINDPAAAKALADGKVVSFDKRNVAENGTIGIKLITDNVAAERAMAEGKDAPGTVKTFPVYQADDEVDAFGVSIIVPHAAAKASGLTVVPLGAYFSTDRLPSTAHWQKLDGELHKSGGSFALYLEAGYTSEDSILLLALTVFAGLITIGAAGIATGLAQADAKADSKTLAAVGAPPRVRRMLSGFQCGVIAAMGEEPRVFRTVI